MANKPDSEVRYMSTEFIGGSWLITVFAAIVVGISGVVRGYAGFGFSALCIASLSFVLPIASLVPIILLLEVCASVLLVTSVWRDVQWRFALGLTLSSVLAAPLGIVILKWVAAETVRTFVLFIILLSSVLLIRGFTLKGHQSIGRIAMVGFCAGAVNAVGAVGGIIYSLFLIADGLPRAQFRASLVIIFLLVDLISAGLMAQAGLLTQQHGHWLLMLVPPMAVGIWIGSRLFRLSSAKSFKRFVIALLLVLSTSGLMSILYRGIQSS